MKTSIPTFVYPIEAAAALTKARFISFDGNHCGANAKAAGVSIVDADSGDQCPVQGGGIAVVESGGSFSAGDNIASDANGKAVKATALAVTASGDVPNGMTAVLSTSAQPTVSSSGTITGGVTPQAINGSALDESTGTGQFVRVKLGLMYSSIADIEKQIGNDTLIQLTDDDDLKEIGEEIVLFALSWATERINGSLRGRYDLPLDPTPQLITDLATDLAVYRLYERRRSLDMPQSLADKHKNDLKLLDLLQSGKVTVGITSSTSTGPGEIKSNKTSGDRVFSKETLESF